MREAIRDFLYILFPAMYWKKLVQIQSNIIESQDKIIEHQDEQIKLHEEIANLKDLILVLNRLHIEILEK